MSASRFSLLFLALLLIGAPRPVAAQVTLSFYSYSGSVILPGGYPHAYIRLEGTEDHTGEKVLKIFGFTPESTYQAALKGNVRGYVHEIIPRLLAGKKNNRHFSVILSDAQYHQVLAEVEKWRSSTYNLGSRNCLHFVAAIARLVGIDAVVPDNLTRKPKAWLNFVGRRNPQLNATQFD